MVPKARIPSEGWEGRKDLLPAFLLASGSSGVVPWLGDGILCVFTLSSLHPWLSLSGFPLCIRTPVILD